MPATIRRTRCLFSYGGARTACREAGRPFRLMSAGVAGRPLVGCDLSITGCWRSSGGRPERPLLTQAVAFKLEAMGVMDEAIEDGVGIGRVAEHGAMP